jgi:hypothetical protein
MYRKPSSRSGRHEALEADLLVYRKLWYRSLCDIMQLRKCSPVSALKHLHFTVSQELLTIPASEKQNFRLAWNQFIRICNQPTFKL